MSKKVSKKVDSLLLGAWEPIHNVKYEIFSLQVPVPWRQVAQSLASLRSSRGHSKYPSIPVSSLDPIITASFPQIIKTGRYGWQRSGVPWIFATEKVDISSYLPDFVKDWLREEFSWCLGEDEVNSHLQKLNNNDWHWDNKVITNYSWNQPGSNYTIDFRYQIVSDYLAKEFHTDEIASEVDDETQKNKIKHEQQLVNKFVHDCLRDCLNTPIEQGKNPNVLFMAESQNARKMLTWLQNPDLPVNTLPKNLNLIESEKNRLWVVRLRVPTNGEVPVGIDKHSPGKRGSISRLFCWQNVCDSKDNAIYLSLRKLLNTEQNILRKSQSRLDNGDRPAGNPKLLEIAIVHHPGIERDKLASFVHNLRNRWPYFADDVSLPFPFPFIKLAKEYAVSAKDVVEVSNEELEDSEDIIDSD